MTSKEIEQLEKKKIGYEDMYKTAEKDGQKGILSKIQAKIDDIAAQIDAAKAQDTPPQVPEPPKPSREIGTTKSSPKKNKKVSKRPSAASKTNPNPKASEPTPIPKHRDQPTTATTLSWKKKVPTTGLEVMELKHKFKALPVTEPTKVIVPTEAEPGDMILLDEHTQHPMMVLKKAYIDKIQKPTTKDLPKNRETNSDTSGPTPNSHPKKDHPGKGENPIAKKLNNPSPKVSNAEGEAIRKEHCDIDFIRAIEHNSPLENWLEGMVASWNAGKTDEKVQQIYYSKREKAVLAQVKVYEKSNFFTNHLEYYEVCLESGHITNRTKEIEAGKYGDRRTIARLAKVNEYYSDANNYTSCRSWITKAYLAWHNDDDSQKASELYKKYYRNNCLNKRLTETQKKHLLQVHSITRKRYEANKKEKSYYGHFSDVIKTTLNDIAD